MKTVLAALAWVVLILPATVEAARTDFVVANHAEPQTLDPALAQTPSDRRIVAALFEGLVGYSARGGSQPALAEKWTISQDGRTYQFKLRKALWSDGTPVTAQTVKASWLRVLDPKTASPWAGLVGQFIAADQTVVVDALTLKVTFRHPLPALSVLADPAFAAVPVHVLARYEDWTSEDHLVVNGPYRLEGWSPQVKLSLVPNPRYWEPRAVRLARITLLPLEDHAAYRLFLKGGVDWVTSVPADLLAEARERRGFHSVVLPSTNYFRLNVTRPGLNDVRVRRALALAVDRTLLSQRLVSWPSVPLLSFTPRLPGYLPPPFAANEDVKAAQKLLADAGYPGGQGFPTMTILYNTSDKNRAVAELVRGQWAFNLGIPVEIRGTDWPSYLADRGSLRYDVARSGWTAEYNDPLSFLELWTTDHPENDTGYSNGNYDALVARARSLADGPARTKVLTQAETLLAAELPFVPLGTELTGQMIDSTLWTGWVANALDVHPWKGFGPAR